MIPLGEPFKFTKWGIVSGLFWVPGATAGIYGIRNAGLAISVGTWSSLIVVSSFCWGILVFDEKVKSIAGAGGAAMVLICGLVGMSIFSSPPAIIKDDTSSKTKTEELRSDEESTVPLLAHSNAPYKGSDSDNSSEDEMIELTHIDMPQVSNLINAPLPTMNRAVSRPGRITRRKQIDGRNKQLHQEEKDTSKGKGSDGNINDKIDDNKEDVFNFFGGKVRLSRRQMGIMGAVINGVWGGNNMIPMHYAR